MQIFNFICYLLLAFAFHIYLTEHKFSENTKFQESQDGISKKCIENFLLTQKFF